MSLEQHVPVVMKKTQMSGDRAQCGLTSLLPMSCRGRAEAFARRLHTRLRNLGIPGDAAETSWLASRDPTEPRRDSDLFFDFELECESPSSPVEDLTPSFPDRSPSDDGQVPFYEVESDVDQSERKKLDLQNSKPLSNGFKFSTAFYTDRSPVKSQPTPRENGYVDGRLFSAISFEDCARHDATSDAGFDQTDCVTRFSPPDDLECIPLPLPSIESDSDFESAKSEPSDEVFENQKTLVDDDVSENVSTAELEVDPIEPALRSSESIIETKHAGNENSVETEVIIESLATAVQKEESPAPDINNDLLTVEVPNESEHEVEDEKPQRVRRCSSLKTGKTPPGTPGRKKIVRFADVLGLDLADVKTFMDEIPVIPKSAYEDLAGADFALNSPPVRAPMPRPGTLTLVPLFQIPRDITDALESRCVCLETARVAEGTHITVCGSVRVRNLDFHKTVHIRYTMDHWKTYTDLQATYVQGSCDGFSDRFQFVLYAPCIASGKRLEVAVRFLCKGRQYWDNNCGANYCFDCLPLGSAACIAPAQSASLHPTLDWHPSFY